MSGWKKLAAASAAGGAGLNVEDVFSTDLWNGNSSTQDITNGIDLSTEGGMLWIKKRNSSTLADHVVYDSERTYLTYALHTNKTDAEGVELGMYAFNTDGYSLSNDSGAGQRVNTSGYTYAGWTWRKAPKFFDIQTWTGDGTSGRTISHDLGSTPGMVVVKCTSTAGTYWSTWHRSIGEKYILLNTTTGVTNAGFTRTVSSTEYELGPNWADENQSGRTYVGYFFAHNDGDGEFGPDGDADIIKCGSYTGNGLSTGPTVDLGFEPQWILTANITSAQYWTIYDNMRGLPVGGDDVRLHPNRDDSESTAFGALVDLLPNGFRPASSSNQINQNNDTYIYMAIRRGQMATPESASEVFGLNQYTGNNAAGRLITSSGTGVTDMAFINPSSGVGSRLATRLRGYPYIVRNDYNGEINSNTRFQSFDDNNGFYIGSNSQVNSSSYTYLAAMWTRAHGYFDVVEYKGSGGTATKDHNLGVVPEMMWLKNRNDTDGWGVYHKDVGATKTLSLDSHNGALTNSLAFNNTAPTETQFTVGSTFNFSSSFNFTAMLFASVSGVSKVGSYTGNGTSQTIDCGFSSGASYVLVKRTTTTSTGDWLEFNSEYGIVAGNELGWRVNAGGDTGSSVDIIDPANSGFVINQESSYNANVNNAEYIFYAIAAI